jgi:hypothetical protein
MLARAMRLTLSFVAATLARADVRLLDNCKKGPKAPEDGRYAGSTGFGDIQRRPARESEWPREGHKGVGAGARVIERSLLGPLIAAEADWQDPAGKVTCWSTRQGRNLRLRTIGTERASPSKSEAPPKNGDLGGTL